MFAMTKADFGHQEHIVKAQMAMALETEGMELNPLLVKQGVEAILSRVANGDYWVMWHGGEFAGCLMILTEWSDWRSGVVWWIHSVYVLPQFRRQGLFKQSYAKLKEMVQHSEHIRGIRLYVDKRNAGAAATYEALGMSAEHYALYEWLK